MSCHRQQFNRNVVIWICKEIFFGYLNMPIMLGVVALKPQQCTAKYIPPYSED
jgi:hypothetical protein